MCSNTLLFRSYVHLGMGCIWWALAVLTLSRCPSLAIPFWVYYDVNPPNKISRISIDGKYDPPHWIFMSPGLGYSAGSGCSESMRVTRSEYHPKHRVFKTPLILHWLLWTFCNFPYFFWKWAFLYPNDIPGRHTLKSR